MDNLRHRHEARQYLLPTFTCYLRLLELPNLELENIIRQELEKNALLEEVPQELEEEPSTKETKPEQNQQITDDFNILEIFSQEMNLPYENAEEQFDPLDNIPDLEERLFDHLMKQAARRFKDRDLEIAKLVISNIEEDGHLAASPEELCAYGYDIDTIRKIIREIQHFEPAGCAWRDIKESLLSQLECLGYGRESPEYILVQEGLTDLKANHIKDLCKKLNIDHERLSQAKKVITKLDRRPGLKYSGQPSRYVEPDFIIRWQDNHLVAHLREEKSCRLRIKSQYLELLKHPSNVSSAEIAYIRQKAQLAQNLIFAIEQRRKTLTRIINGLLDYQRDFFGKGEAFLKPITMADFARQLDVNPSTVSRAIANKYLESPRGIHKMKYFFTAPVSKTDKRLIYEKIKEIIAGEEKAAPLSDAQIAKKLSREGIIISRRTVSKYRQGLKIPAHQYRREA